MKCFKPYNHSSLCTRGFMIDIYAIQLKRFNPYPNHLDLVKLYKPNAMFLSHNDEMDDAMSETSDMSIDPSSDLEDSVIDCLLSVLTALDSHCRSRAMYELLSSIVEKYVPF